MRARAEVVAHPGDERLCIVRFGDKVAMQLPRYAWDEARLPGEATVEWAPWDGATAPGPAGGALVLSGQVYRAGETSCLVSCGGLLVELPAGGWCPGDGVRVVVSEDSPSKRTRV